MAHQDYGTICPIFTEGVEKEMFIPYPLVSCTLSIPITKMPAGREITVMEIGALVYTSDTCYQASSSLTIGVFKVQGSVSTSLSNRIGSICLGSADMSQTCGFKAGSVTSTSFTSTDMICIANVSFGEAFANAFTPTIVIRYRDK